MKILEDLTAFFATPFPDMGLDPKTLSFNSMREASYWRHRAERLISQRRLSLLVCALITLIGIFFEQSGGAVSLITSPLTLYYLVIAAILLMLIGSYYTPGKRHFRLLSTLMIALLQVSQHVALWHSSAEQQLAQLAIFNVVFFVTMTLLTTQLVASLAIHLLSYLALIVFFVVKSSLSVSQSLTMAACIALSFAIAAVVYYLSDYHSRRLYYLLNADKFEVTTLAEREVVKRIESPINKMYDSLVDVIWFITIEGDIKYISKSVKDFLGYEAEELIDKRAILLMPRASYADFEQKTGQLYRGINLIQETFAFKTKAGLIKSGETLIRAYSDKRFGDGYIGSTRPITEQKARLLKTDRQQTEALMNDVQTLKHSNQNYLREIEDLRAKLTKLSDIQRRAQLMTKSQFVTYNAAIERQLNNHIAIISQEHHHQLERLAKKFQSKRMAKYDLRQYISQASASLHYVSQYIDMLSKERALSTRLLTDADLSEMNEVNLADQLARTVISMADYFKVNQHTIEIKCQNDIALALNSEGFELMIQLLIARSLIKHFAETDRGNILIDVVREDAAIRINYSDNGKVVAESEAIRVASSAYGQVEDELIDRQYPLLSRASQRYCRGRFTVESTRSNHFIIEIN